MSFRNSLIFKFLLKIQEYILIICSVATVIIIGIEVALRYFFRADLLGYEEIVIILAMWLYFLGGSYTTYKKNHISAEVVNLFLTERAQKIVALFVSIITMIVAIIFALWGFDFFRWALERKAMTSGLRIPLLLSQSALFFGYLMMAFYSLVYAIEDILLFIGWQKKNAEGI